MYLSFYMETMRTMGISALNSDNILDMIMANEACNMLFDKIATKIEEK